MTWSLLLTLPVLISGTKFQTNLHSIVVTVLSSDRTSCSDPLRTVNHPKTSYTSPTPTAPTNLSPFLSRRTPLLHPAPTPHPLPARFDLSLVETPSSSVSFRRLECFLRRESRVFYPFNSQTARPEVRVGVEVRHFCAPSLSLREG